MTFAVNRGIRIHYEVEGTGEPLVLHHGLLNCGEAWREDGYVEQLKKHFQLILLDARGHGASDKPLDASCYAAKAMVGDVVTVLDSLGISRAHYWGYSLGAIVGLSMLKHAPQYLQSLIAGGYSPYANYTDPEGQYLCGLRASLLVAVEGGMGAWLALVEEQTGEPWPPHLALRLGSNEPCAVLACLDGAALSWSGVGEVLRSSTVRCLLYAGDVDSFHLRVKEAAQELPNATFISLSGLEHIQTWFAADLILPHAESFLCSASEPAA